MQNFPPDDELFIGDGHVRSLLRVHDWAGFPAGPPAQWPSAIQHTILMLLDTAAPMSFLWGPEHIYFYNDAYIELVAAEHPVALARPFGESRRAVTDVFSSSVKNAMSGKACTLATTEFSVIRKDMPAKAYFNFSLLPIFDEYGAVNGVLNLATDVTGQVLASRRHQFQLQLADLLRPLTDPDEVIATACELLGNRLGVARMVYVAADESAETVTVTRDWTNDTVPTMAGTTFRLDDFGPLLAGLLRAGKPLVVDDVTTDASAAAYAAAYAAIGVRAALAVPLMKDGRLRAILSAHDTAVHHWTRDEIALADDMVDRTWHAVESARSLAELRYERDQSTYIFDSMTEGFALVDNDWTVLRVNAEGLRIAQREQHDVTGRNHWDVWPELRGTQLEEIYRQVKHTRKAQIFDFPYIFPNGQSGWIEGRAYPTLDGGLALFFRDISERKNTQKALENADRRKDEFLAMLAHELRNPLAPIGAAAELLQVMKLDEARVRHTSQIICRQVRHMSGLIDDLLDVSRVTRGLVELDKAPVEVSHIINDAIEQVTPLIRSRHQHLEIELAPLAPLVMGDRKRLVQVVANLLNNAAKYTHEGGHLTVKTGIRETEVFIEVIDNGIGMTADLVGRAFDLFAQAERSADRSSGGLGLGLALVKSLVGLHRGTVTCDSAGLGRGSKFAVYLPHLPRTAAMGSSPTMETSIRQSPHSLRVMVVDDNVDAASMLAMLLETAGYEVSVEHDSQRALERIRIEAPQVCLLDIGLPEINGNELARRLRAVPETTRSLLIAITGYGQEGDRAQSIAAGFDHHLVKPVDTTKLLAILAKARVS